MKPEGEGYKNLQPDVTQDSRPTPQGSSRRRPSREKILAVLKSAETPLQPKIISHRSGLNHSTVKVECRRLAHENLIVKTETGYVLPSNAFEQQLELELQLNGQKESLPKIHDIHLTLKPENVRKALKNPGHWQPLVQVTYDIADREPVDNGLQNAYKKGYKNIPCLSSSDHPLDQFFNTINPMSIYQLWRENGAHTKQIKGGFQEYFDLRTHKLIVQLYGTGTIKIIISNSEHPMDAIEFRESLATIDGLFLSKTNIRFMDIAHFFYVEKIHFNSDKIGDREFSGTSRLNFTVKQLDDWLYRVYEKVMGDDLFIRTEACLEKGNFDDHNLGAMVQILQGGVTPSIVSSQLFLQGKNSESLTNDVRRTQAQINQQSEQNENLYKIVSRQQDQIENLYKAVSNLADMLRQSVKPITPESDSGFQTGHDFMNKE